MKHNNIVLILHYGIVALLVAYGTFATLQIRKFGDRLGTLERQLGAVDEQLGKMETQLAHVHDFKPQALATSR